MAQIAFLVNPEFRRVQDSYSCRYVMSTCQHTSQHSLKITLVFFFSVSFVLFFAHMSELYCILYIDYYRYTYQWRLKFIYIITMELIWSVIKNKSVRPWILNLKWKNFLHCAWIMKVLVQSYSCVRTIEHFQLYLFAYSLRIVFATFWFQVQ